MSGNSRYPFPPLEADITLTDPRMRRWLQNVWEDANSVRMAAPVPFPTIGASPYLFQYIGAGQASLLINNGTVSLVEFSRDGATFYPLGTATDSSYLLNQDDYLRITYSSAPDLTLVAR